ncbi:MAG: hypothetical protein ACTSVU_07075 [Promethearchaeota archaeon]
MPDDPKKKQQKESWIKIQIANFQKTLIKASIQKSISEYFLQAIIPGVIGGIALGIGVVELLKDILGSGAVWFFIPLICLILSVGIIIFYPHLRVDIRRGKINATLPLLITYMGGISTSRASRDQLFENVAKREKSFGIAALEIRRIHTLAIEWNFGYVDAIEKVSTTTPSFRFADFLSRFSQALDAGEELESYFQKEQSSQLNKYIADYHRKLKSLEMLNDAYTAISTSVSFIAITFLLMMYLFGGTQQANTRNLFLLLGIMVMVNIAMMIAFWTTAPRDKLLSIQRKTAEYEKVLYSFLICLFIFLPILIGLAAVLKDKNGNNIINMDMFMIIFGIALIIPGRFTANFEENVSRRDENFPVFIRTLGSTTTLLGGSIFDSVNIISHEEFGPLTEGIKLLYTQSKFGIDPTVAWKWFSDSTCSNLIDRFLRIFISSMDIGGSPEIVSRFISVNVEKILLLRQDRKQVIGTFKGTMLPLTIINIGTMIFMKDVTSLLNTTMGALSNIQGMNLHLGVAPDQFFVDLYFNTYYIIIPLFACIALMIPGKGSWMKVTKFLAQYYIIVGFELIIIGNLSHSILASFGNPFAGQTLI